MKNNTLILSLFVIFIISNSCRKVIDVKLPEKEGKIVINSFFTPGEPFRVNVSKSLSILDNKDAKFLDGAIVNIFENNDFRRGLLNSSRGKKGLHPLQVCVDYTGLKEHALDRLAEMVRANLDIEFIERMLKL